MFSEKLDTKGGNVLNQRLSKGLCNEQWQFKRGVEMGVMWKWPDDGTQGWFQNICGKIGSGHGVTSGTATPSIYKINIHHSKMSKEKQIKRKNGLIWRNIIGISMASMASEGILDKAMPIYNSGICQ